MNVTLDLPDEYFPQMDAAMAAQRLKLYAALILYQAEHLSMGAACELAEMDRYTFLAACKEHNIPVIRYGSDEVEDEVQALRATEG